MVNKPIIINGVDVSDCEYLGLYKEYKFKCGGCYTVDCSDNPNCYYKQLIHECKLSQEAMDNYVKLDNQRVKEYNKLVDLYKAKEQECEESKKERDTLSITRNKFLDDLRVTEENLKDYMEHFNKASDKLDQLKQTLTEIEEIAKEQMHYLNIAEAKTMIEVEYDYAGAMYNLEQRMSKILQKISECKVNND